MSPDDHRHGTNAGYLQHITDRETSCQPCREAHAEARRNLWRKRYLRGVDRLYIDSTGSIRRIRALMAIGWRLADINVAAGHGVGSGWAHNICTQKAVHVDTAEKVAAVFDAMCMTPGPSARGRSIAAKRGWAPPLAWDDEAIDDPNAHPAGATIATVTPIRERTWDTADHRACPRCGVVRSTHADGLRGDLCRDCRQEVA